MLVASTGVCGAARAEMLAFSASRPLCGSALAPLQRSSSLSAPLCAPIDGSPRMAMRAKRTARSLKRPGGRVAMASDMAMTGEGKSSAPVPSNWATVLWEFSRPHTIVGSVLSVISLHLFAATAPGVAVMNVSAFVMALTWAIVCAVLVNVYVTGLNQIFDVEIDKINKPYLPIAAGQLSLKAAWMVCIGALVLGIVPSLLFYPYDKIPLLSVTVGSALLGTAYSAPPLRLKRFPLFAALCIIVVSRALSAVARCACATRRC
jgi:hypothetical protein